MDVDTLTHDELLTLAGLLRIVVRLDGRFSDEEQAALADIAQQVAEVEDVSVGDPYRERAMVEPLGEARLYALLEEAALTLDGEAAVRRAVRAVERTEARDAIHAAVSYLASTDLFATREVDLLSWLREEWGLESA